MLNPPVNPFLPLLPMRWRGDQSESADAQCDPGGRDRQTGDPRTSDKDASPMRLYCVLCVPSGRALGARPSW